MFNGRRWVCQSIQDTGGWDQRADRTAPVIDFGARVTSLRASSHRPVSGGSDRWTNKAPACVCAHTPHPHTPPRLDHSHYTLTALTVFLPTILLACMLGGAGVGGGDGGRGRGQGREGGGRGGERVFHVTSFSKGLQVTKDG